MTYGQMLVTDGTESVDLYTWHDGHAKDALKMLMQLPFDVFKASKDYSKTVAQDKYTVPSGPWFYSVMVSGSSDRKKATFDDMIDTWDSMLPLHTAVIGVANWLVWRHFGMWHVVPSKEWMAYPHAPSDITITVKKPERSRGRLYGYELELAPDNFESDNNEFSTEYTEGMIQLMEQTAAILNKKIQNDVAKITVYGKKELGPNGWKYPKVFVPFDHIVVDQLHQDVQNFNFPVKPTGRQGSIPNNKTKVKHDTKKK